MDGAAVLAKSVWNLKSEYDKELVAFLAPGIATSRAPLKALGYMSV